MPTRTRQGTVNPAGRWRQREVLGTVAASVLLEDMASTQL